MDLQLKRDPRVWETRIKGNGYEIRIRSEMDLGCRTTGFVEIMHVRNYGRVMEMDERSSQ